MKRILLLGAGPTVIGQAGEFDYSGTQGAKTLQEEGYEIILVDSNPATIMTDPEFAARTYIEPLEWRTLAAIIERERPDAILPTLGGQTALNVALKLHEEGVLEKHGVEMLGARPESIAKAENRSLFKAAMEKIGLQCPKARAAHSIEEAWEFVEETGFPAILRPSFTLGETGGDVIKDASEFEAKVTWALTQSPTREVLIEESVIGWKAIALEVIRDKADNVIVVCSIENVEPVGDHTGNSITVVPAMTLTDCEYQRLRDAARAVVVEIGVASGGSSVHFAVSPRDGRFYVMEMNPRVSHSSALASKATGYPIAKVATKLAVGYTLDELCNDSTRTGAVFEPVVDYVVVKWPRFAFESFQCAETALDTQMKSLGEAMGIGHTFCEALQKAARSLGTGHDGFVSLLGRVDYSALSEWLGRPRTPDPSMTPPDIDARSFASFATLDRDELVTSLRKVVKIPTADRLFYVGDAMRAGIVDEDLHALTGIDPWFLGQIRRLIVAEHEIARGMTARELRHLKRLGFSDQHIGKLAGLGADHVRALRHRHDIRPVYARVDELSAQFAAHIPYLYSTYATESKANAQGSGGKKVVILGSGPNRIGQGIEFEYCCVHAMQALRSLGIETIMVNSNPETVSSAFDASDRLYVEPVTLEDVLAIVDEEKPLGVIVQFGGQTPLHLAVPLKQRGVELLGTTADAIDRAEDRERFDRLLQKLALRRTRSGVANGFDDACRVAANIGYPVVVRPGCMLGGRGMMIAHSRQDLDQYIQPVVQAARYTGTQTIRIDEFLEDAIEVDVDCVADGQRAVIGGVMQQIQQADIHSGNSTSVLPPHSLSTEIVLAIEDQTRLLALELGVVGVMNVQFAVRKDDVYILKVNPRASRTLAFVSKATGRPLAKIAAKIIVGETLEQLGVEDMAVPAHVCVKESVFPFTTFAGVDFLLGPQLRSTGEVMGIAETFARSFHKAMLASGIDLTALDQPHGLKAFMSVKSTDKPGACFIARRLRAIGYDIVATRDTAAALASSRIHVDLINQLNEPPPHVLDALRCGAIGLVINTTSGAKEIRDSYPLRRQTLLLNVPYFATIAAAAAACDVIESHRADAQPCVKSLQQWHAEGSRAPE